MKDNFIDLEKIRIDPLPFINKFHTTLDVLRLDLIHDIVSGNKWFKLNKYLDDAISKDKSALLSFGGAYSNHIVATAAACKEKGLSAIGIIRGEKPPVLSHTLENAIQSGMQLYFISREDYKQKIIPPEVYEQIPAEEIYIVNEGGYGIKGMEGAKEILDLFDTASYDHIVAAAGTGTMLAGLVAAAAEHQHLTGISVLKNNYELPSMIDHLLPVEKKGKFRISHEYHFGGYAKHTPSLISFMNDIYMQFGIPSDFVYTGKLLFAVNDLLDKGYFIEGSKVLIIHSGGLQGNLSLPKGTLIF